MVSDAGEEYSAIAPTANIIIFFMLLPFSLLSNRGSKPRGPLNLRSLSPYNCRDIVQRIFTHTGTNANFIRFIRMSQMKLRKWRTSAVPTAAYSI